MREEIFGRCAALMPFDTEEEAITLANDTEYELAARPMPELPPVTTATRPENRAI
jgi:hypothetical protein